ncbi:winged helix-turn-helix transcriptional regulator [Nibricoccus sp. IMCC34717]|uniref:winged helix-turn-helix transcriptional regulator n=1 Tax=Nibricoccus sp. IMCC34717 TaxID=3034021 RepID=UPI00384FB090
MARSIPAVSAATITESVLKRKWTGSILRHFATGLADPEEIRKLEPELSPTVFSQRLRTLQRYGLIARFPRPGLYSSSEYRITILGRKIIGLLDQIDDVDRELSRLQQEHTPINRSRA